MPSPLPEGEPAPPDGHLPATALAEIGHRPLGVYVHVPFCATRCGYCDFTTYTADELGPASGATRATWADAALAELDLAASVLGEQAPRVGTVFVGGGTPTLLPPEDLGRVLDGVASRWGLEAAAEITVEANPETLTPDVLDGLRCAGVTRLSMGMQSAVPHVLATLDRVHTPGQVARAVRDARAAGFATISLDVIYGTPGESLDDWDDTLDAVIALRPEHLSAYGLTVEDGTRLAARIRRGELDEPDDDLMAEMYERADGRLCAAGYAWYEVSSWACSDDHRCRHNVGYWAGSSWWGVGPGAHSHVGGVRWWNVRHPARWAQQLGAGASPALARETLGDESRRLERIMLGLRTVTGADVVDIETSLGAQASQRLDAMVAGGLLQREPLARGRAVLTRRGRLLASRVTDTLT